MARGNDPARRELRPGIELVDSDGHKRRAVVEHPYPVRLAHWAIAIALPILAMSGLQILRAFPSFEAKIPRGELIAIPRWATLGGWLAGAIQWHFTFMWVFLAAGAVYVVYQIASGNWRQVVVSRRDLQGILPMVRHYLLRRPEPPYDGAYNPLQKLAYTVVLLLGALAALSGLALWRPAQLSLLVALFGGFQNVRIAHFVAMLGLAAFVPGHLLLVAIAGFDNFRSMLVGFKLRSAAEPRRD
jgi:thiosulfate reductase cytochrome b subunit